MVVLHTVILGSSLAVVSVGFAISLVFNFIQHETIRDKQMEINNLNATQIKHEIQIKEIKKTLNNLNTQKCIKQD